MICGEEGVSIVTSEEMEKNKNKKDEDVLVDQAWLKLNAVGFKESQLNNHGELWPENCGTASKRTRSVLDYNTFRVAANSAATTKKYVLENFEKLMESQTKADIKCSPDHGFMQTALTMADGDTTFGGARSGDAVLDKDKTLRKTMDMTTRNAAAAVAESQLLCGRVSSFTRARRRSEKRRKKQRLRSCDCATRHAGRWSSSSKRR